MNYYYYYMNEIIPFTVKMMFKGKCINGTIIPLKSVMTNTRHTYTHYTYTHHTKANYNKVNKNQTVSIYIFFSIPVNIASSIECIVC